MPDQLYQDLPDQSLPNFQVWWNYGNQFSLALATKLSFSVSVTFARWQYGTLKEVVHVGRWAQAGVKHGGQWTQAVRGVAGRANVKLCFSSSLVIRVEYYRLVLHI